MSLRIEADLRAEFGHRGLPIKIRNLMLHASVPMEIPYTDDGTKRPRTLHAPLDIRTTGRGKLRPRAGPRSWFGERCASGDGGRPLPALCGI